MYLFALFLVLYEFTTYSANDMIMPGMLQVVTHFHAPEYYVAFALSFYLLGNCAFILLAGLLAERYGKRCTMLWGNFLFLLFTIIIILSASIHQFILWRFFQGAGLAIIAIGYALIHENFNDKDAIKLIALMANVSVLAPLIGPGLGSLMMSYLSWQAIFVLTAILSGFTFVGLFLYTPRVKLPASTKSVLQIMQQYGAILKNKEFCFGMLCTTILVLPLLIWIGEAPNLILYKLHLNYMQYAIYQFISIGGLITSTIVMQFMVGNYRIYRIVKIGALLVLLGVLMCLLGSQDIRWIALGMLIYALGMGLANGCIMRLVMTITGYSHAMLASMLGFMQTLLLFIGITVTNEFISHQHFSSWSFTLSLFLFGASGFLLVNQYISAYKTRGWL